MEKNAVGEFYGHDKFTAFVDSKKLWLPTQGLHKPVQISVLLAEEHLRPYARGAMEVREAASFSLRLGPLVFYEYSAGWHHTHACLGALIELMGH